MHAIRRRRAAGLVLSGSLLGCFTAPSDPVLFRCEPDRAPQCPPGYACLVDGCCHRYGSDPQEDAGSCRFGSGRDTDGDTGMTSLPSGDTGSGGSGMVDAGSSGSETTADDTDE